VKDRATRDQQHRELEQVARPTLDKARSALEKKALIYDKLKRGKSGGLSDAQYEALLVDVRPECWHIYTIQYSQFACPLVRLERCVRV
jgi:hypothetical protein